MRYLAYVSAVLSLGIAVDAVRAANPPPALALAPGIGEIPALDGLYRRVAEGMRSFDANTVSTAFARDGILLQADGTTASGRGNVAAFYRKALAPERQKGDALRLSFTVTKREVSNRLAYDVGSVVVRRISDGPAQADAKYPFVVVAGRADDGSWRIKVFAFQKLP